MAETAAQKKKRLAAEAKAKADAQVAADNAAKEAQTKAQIGGYLSANFGLTDSILAMDTTGGLRAAMDEIINGRIVDANLAANILAKTDWFKTHGVEVTKRLSQETSAPGVFSDGVASYAASLKDQAVASGFDVSDADIQAIARDGYIYGRAVNSSEVLNKLGTKGTVSSGNTSVLDLKAFADKYGVVYPDSWYKDAATSVGMRNTQLSKWQNDIIENAKSSYPALAKQIDANIDTRTAGAGYISKIAQNLELDPTQVKLTDPLLQKAFTNLDDKGDPVAPPLWQFERAVKQDERYFKTNKANQEFTGLATEIARQFGKAV